jgi:hypothetical protein
VHDENKTPTDPNVDFDFLKDHTPTNGDIGSCLIN